MAVMKLFTGRRPNEENTLATMAALYPQAFAAAAAADSPSGRALRVWRNEGLNSTAKLSISLAIAVQNRLS